VFFWVVACQRFPLEKTAEFYSSTQQPSFPVSAAGLGLEAAAAAGDEEPPAGAAGVLLPLESRMWRLMA